MANLDGIDEQSLDWLRCFDTMFIIDDSAAMAPYWKDVQLLIEKVAPICAKHDPDGIDLYFVNRQFSMLPSSTGPKFAWNLEGPIC
jgi:hypothetical protein